MRRAQKRSAAGAALLIDACDAGEAGKRLRLR
jgi:hypothetical protein